MSPGENCGQNLLDYRILPNDHLMQFFVHHVVMPFELVQKLVKVASFFSQRVRRLLVNSGCLPGLIRLQDSGLIPSMMVPAIVGNVTLTIDLFSTSSGNAPTGLDSSAFGRWQSRHDACAADAFPAGVPPGLLLSCAEAACCDAVPLGGMGNRTFGPKGCGTY